MKKSQSSQAREREASALRRYRAEYVRLKRRLLGLGYVCLGSVARRWLPCGQPSCVCHRDPTKRHGPYYHWTRKIGGKTQSVMLSVSLAHLYREGIRNHRHLDRILEQMREVSVQAFGAAKVASRR